MNRRKFIKKTILGVPTSLWLPAILTSCGEEEVVPITTDKKVVIIGAGIAGLGAARFFKDREVEVILLEAQERVGGRLRTDRSLGIPFDEGASWIHGPNGGNPITKLADAAGANTFFTDDDNVAVFDVDGSQYPDSGLDDAEGEYDSILADFPGEINRSFQDVFYANYPQFQNNRLWTYQLSAFLEFDTGADISKLSSLDFFDDQAFPGKDVILANGYDTIAEHLRQGIDVRLNTRVEGIDYSDEKINIATNGASFEADFLIIAAPLGVLKRGAIAFSPSLPPAKHQAISKLEMGTVNKFLCVWDSAFWDTDLQYIGYTAEEKGKFNYFLNLKKFADTNALMTFAFGNYAIQTEQMSDAQISAEIMSHLRSIYGNNIPNPTNMLGTRWGSNENAFGSYAFTPAGTRSTDFDILAESVNDKLFFAGEHTSRDYRGTVPGAFLSGEREARKIIALL